MLLMATVAVPLEPADAWYCAINQSGWYSSGCAQILQFKLLGVGFKTLKCTPPPALPPGAHTYLPNVYSSAHSGC